MFNDPTTAAADVFIEPPDDAVLTDEDSGKEDDVGLQHVHHLSRNQLLAPAELQMRGNHPHEDDPNDDSNTDQSIEKTSDA